MADEPTGLDLAIDALTTPFAEGLNRLATGAYLREGIVKQGINSLIWELYHEMPDQREALAEAIEIMPDIIRKAASSAREADAADS